MLVNVCEIYLQDSKHTGKTSGTGTQYKTRVVRKRLAAAAAVENLNFEIQRSWKTSV